MSLGRCRDILLRKDAVMMRRFRYAVLALVLLGVGSTAFGADPNPPSIRSNRGAWPIRRQWNPAETQHFARWMENIFLKKTEGTVDQRIAKLERVLTDPEMNLLLQPEFLGTQSNPQLPKNVIRQMNSLVDCAKLTAILPAYYAYRRALPWMSSYVTSTGGDVRTSAANIPVGFESSFTSPSVGAFFSSAVSGFSSGNYRVEPNARNAEWSDTVPVSIDPKYLLPGCIMYVDGHCLLLADITEYGELRFLNASTTTTRDIYTYNGMNAVHGITPAGSQSDENEWAGCFQGLRVFRYPIAETNSKGEVTRVRRRTDEEMKEFGFSLEQYTRLHELLEKHEIDVGGLKPQSLHDFIRLRMMTVKRIVPAAFIQQYSDELLETYKFREEFVQDAWRDVRQNGPIVYPEERTDENIFQAFGRWETWSSPSSDVDRRNKYFYLGEWMDFAVRMFGMMPEFVDLTGMESYEIKSQADLAQAMVDEKNKAFAARSMHYLNSKGQNIQLTLTEIEKRLYDFSFDPNHPPELRWGAPAGSEERASAPSTFTPVPGGTRIPMEEAYLLQTYYRTVSQRETEMSCLRGMFTEGFPLRDKIDMFIGRWNYLTEPTEAIQAWLQAKGAVEAPPADTRLKVFTR